MQRKLIIVSILLLFLQCSKKADEIIPETEVVTDNPTEQENEPKEDSNDIEVLSISVLVDANFFTDGFEGELFLTNKAGEIVKSKKLENDSNNVLEIEVETQDRYDLTYVYRNSIVAGIPVEIKTFMDIASGNFLMETPERNTPIGSSVTIAFSDTGFPLEEVNYFTRSVLEDASGTGSYELRSKPSWHSSSLYAAFISPNDGFPRYYFESNLTSSSYDVNYQELPSIENKAQISLPLEAEFFRTNLWGLLDNNGQREWLPVDGSEKANDEYYYPQDIFDSYIFTASMSFKTPPLKDFSISYFGEPSQLQFTLPELNGSVLNDDINDFRFVSDKPYDYWRTFYKYHSSETSTFYLYDIYGKASEVVTFSNGTMIDNLFEEDESVSSEDLKFDYFIMIKNPALKGNYNGYVQSFIDRFVTFPQGTLVESLRVN